MGGGLDRPFLASSLLVGMTRWRLTTLTHRWHSEAAQAQP
jgi:hypothetical protein